MTNESENNDNYKSRIYKYPHKKKQLQLRRKFKKEVGKQVQQKMDKVLNKGLWKILEPKTDDEIWDDILGETEKKEESENK